MPNRACETNWTKEAMGDALGAIDHFEDTIIEQLKENGEASDDLNNDYPSGDEYRHETFVDRSYTLLEAAHLLDDLSRYEETDNGLWEGVEDPERALETKAAFTYGNAVMAEFDDLIKDLNTDYKNDFDGTPAGPKEWRPGKSRKPQAIKVWLTGWIKERRDKLR